MEDFKKLDELADMMAQRDYLVKKRKVIAETLTSLSQEEIRLQSQSKKETNDYKSMEQIPIKKLMKLFSENYEELLNKEYREMKIAQYKYEALLEKIKSLQGEITNINELLKQYDEVEPAYKVLLNAKMTWANQNGFAQVEDYEREIRNIRFHIKELDEAILALKRMLLSLTSAKGELASMLSVNNEKIINESLIPESIKRDQIKRVSQFISDSMEKSDHLMRELRDLKPYFDHFVLEAMGRAESFDVYFERIFSEKSMSSQVEEAYRTITVKFEASKRLLIALEKMKTSCEDHIESITKKRNEMILSL